MIEDIIDEGSKQKIHVPGAVMTIGTLSIIGSSLWIVVLLLSVYFLMNELNGQYYYAQGALLNLIYFIFALLIVLNVLAIIGAAKIMSGSKGAFLLYAITTGIWIFFMLYISYSMVSEGISKSIDPTLFVVSGISSILFVALFGAQMKNMPIR